MSPSILRIRCPTEYFYLTPSFSPTSTCVASPWRVEYTGAQMIVENRESISACRLTTTNTRKRFGSRAGGLAFRSPSNTDLYRKKLFSTRACCR